MGKVTGFVEWQRVVPKRRAVGERLRDWREVDAPIDSAEIRRQAGRCMDCGVPFCQHGCPLGNPIPEFDDLVWNERWRDAHRQLALTNEFPEFTGRLCPAPCEASCVLAIGERSEPMGGGDPAGSAGGAGGNAPRGVVGAAVTIEAIEKAIAERAFAEGWIAAQPPRHRTGRRVAIVGSGPAGLAAAARLNRAGHRAVVYESAARPGGLLRYGIPDFKIEKWVVDRRLALLEAEGVEFRCGVNVGVEPTWHQLRADHDAIVLAIGAMRPRELAVPGRDLAGVVLAMDYLVDQNERRGRFDVAGKRVVILGGGDTGSDCLGTALRQGAREVRQIEIMPQPPATRAATNPWPQWPLVFRTSSSQQEGGEREFAFRTTHLEGDGPLRALHGVRVDSGEPLRIDVDVLILALGFTGPDTSALGDQLGIAVDGRGNIAVDAASATNVPGVYCAGDARRGASLIVWAIADGRDTATHVDAYLGNM